MTKSLIALAVSLFSFSFHSAAQEGTEPGLAQVVHIECHGYVDKFSVFFTTTFLPDNIEGAVSSLEIGYVLKTWQPKREYEFVESRVSSEAIAIEGTVGAGQGSFRFDLPSLYSIAGSESSFTTGITVRTSVVRGKLMVNCQTSLKQVKSKTKYTYN
jgi:hypothetical protein